MFSSNTKYKSFHDYTVVKKLQMTVTTGGYMHPITIVKKTNPHFSLFGLGVPPKYVRNWYRKLVGEDKKVAWNEVVAQEFFRLVNPAHPKTRYCQHQGTSYVLSAEIPGYQSFGNIPAATIKKNVKEGVYKGLGEVMVLALFLNEVDLRLFNLGIDKDNNVIKIDGDWCFARLREKGKISRNYNITSDLLDNLPYLLLEDYYACSWLDVIDHDLVNDKPKTVDDSFLTLEHLRAEINRAILKILILPEELIRTLITQHVDDETHCMELIDETLARQTLLRNAALANRSFLTYLDSEQALADLYDYMPALQSFKMPNKTAVPIFEEDGLQHYLKKALLDLQESSKSQCFARESVSQSHSMTSEARLFSEGSAEFSQQGSSLSYKAT